MSDIVRIPSISEMNKALGLAPPAHPLISIYYHNRAERRDFGNIKFTTDFYQIFLKDGGSCEIGYGRSSYDYEDGSMMFIAPNQVMSAGVVEYNPESIGWTLCFHPNLIRKADLGQKMDSFSFFSYDNNEALHLSQKEVETVTQIVKAIEDESSQNIDRHSQPLIVSNLELLLNYCTRFYDRQFYTRTNLNKDLVSRFEALLKNYYLSDLPAEEGIPSVQYCGREMGMTPHYLSDLLKRETGKNALEHIHLFIIEQAKNRILGSDDSITRISYDLGFEYPQHFSKLFKAKTGMTPREYRAS